MEGSGQVEKQEVGLGSLGKSLIIDCDAAPRMFNGFLLSSHEKLGNIAFDPNKIGLFITKEQENGFSVIGNDLIGRGWTQKFQEREHLNANYLDWLFLPENNKYIPDDWFGKDVFFLGTIFSVRSKYVNQDYVYVYTKYARYLRCSRNGLQTDLYCLNNKFGKNDYMAILKK